MKLIGGKYSNEGTVLVCYNNLWGLISDTAWSNGDARVVCRSLGHSDGSKLYINYMHVIILLALQLLSQFLVHNMESQTL